MQEKLIGTAKLKHAGMKKSDTAESFNTSQMQS